MGTLKTHACANCGAQLPVAVSGGTFVTCEHCRATFQAPTTLTPELAFGNLLLGADFKDDTVPGWKIAKPNPFEFKSDPPEMWAKFKKSVVIHPVVYTPGPFDDIDVSVTIRFIKGKTDRLSAGFEMRNSESGDYVTRISPKGNFNVGWHSEMAWGGHLVNWTRHPAIEEGLKVNNRLRAVVQGDRIRIYLNGVLATSLRDDRFSHGRIRIVAVPSEHSNITVAISDLQLREVIDNG